MNIPFRPVTAADADLLRSYTMESKCMNCDMNVTNLCGWQFLYHTEWAIVEGFLVLRFVSGGQVTYMKPIGKGDLRRVLELFPRLDVKKFNITNDKQFARDLLTEAKILIVPGSGFDWPDPDHFRIVMLPKADELRAKRRQALAGNQYFRRSQCNGGNHPIPIYRYNFFI